MGQTDFLIDNDKFWQGFETARDEYLSHGVTMAQNAWVSRSFLEYFATVPADKDPGIDVILLPIGDDEPAMTNGHDAVNWQIIPISKLARENYLLMARSSFKPLIYPSRIILS